MSFLPRQKSKAMSIRSTVSYISTHTHTHTLTGVIYRILWCTRGNVDLSPTVNNALSEAEQALLSGDEDKLYEALKAMGIQNLQPQNKAWYLKQLQGDRENKEQVGSTV